MPHRSFVTFIAFMKSLSVCSYLFHLYICTYDISQLFKLMTLFQWWQLLKRPFPTSCSTLVLHTKCNVHDKRAAQTSEPPTFHHHVIVISNYNTTTLIINYNDIRNRWIRQFYSLLTSACIMARFTANATTPRLCTSPPYTTTILLRFLHYLLTHSLLI